MINKLNCAVKNFTHIVHVADIHVRLTKRHEEYEEVFNKFYEEVKKTPTSTAIVILGDLYHSKSDLSPECVQSVQNFLYSCSELRPTVLIAGNHDATLTNKNRLDSLTPIVRALNHTNLFYLKDSGLYGLGNVLFSVCSVFDPENFVLYKDIPKCYIHQYHRFIALIHAPIDKCFTDFGYRIDSRTVKAEMFDGYEICLAGDIHKMQDIFIEKEIDDCELDDYLNTRDWEIVKNYTSI